jgi:hypothetical protein
MTISYAGYPLYDPTVEVMGEIAAYLSFEKLNDFSRPSWPSRNLTDFAFPFLDKRPPIELNTLWWPQGASRWAVGYFLVTEATKQAIEAVVYGSFPTNPNVTAPFYLPQDLVFNDGTNGAVPIPMYMLPPRPLDQCFKTPPSTYQIVPSYDPGLWLLTLVDDRYHWWLRSDDIDPSPDTYSLSAGTSLVGGSGYTIGASLTVDGGTFTTPASLTVSGVGASAVAVSGGGTGYNVGDVLMVDGGDFSTPAVLQVTGVSSGAITSVSLENDGDYTLPPTGTLSVSGGAGTGASLTGTFSSLSAFTVDDPGDYSVPPTNPISLTGAGSGATISGAFATGWLPVLNALGEALGIADLEIDEISSAYLSPPVDLMSRYDYLPIILDAAAYSVGKRVAVLLDGSVSITGPATAMSFWQLGVTTFGLKKIKGGTMLLDGSKPANDVVAAIPSFVAVSFPITRNSFPGCSPYLSPVAVSSLTVPNLSAVQTSSLIDTRYFQCTAAAGYNTSGTLDNQAELDALAAQLASDWVSWQLAPLDVQFQGTIPWPIEGMHDVIWSDHGMPMTRVIRTPWNEWQQQILTSGTYGSTFYTQISAVVQANSESKIGNYYDAVLAVDFDSDSPSFADGQPCWLYDPTGATSIKTAYPYSGCTLIGEFQGRPIYSLPVGFSCAPGSGNSFSVVTGFNKTTCVATLNTVTGTVTICGVTFPVTFTLS